MANRDRLGLPQGFEPLDDELPPGYEPIEPIESQQRADELPPGYEPIEEEPSFFSNVLAGAGERAGDLGSALLKTIQTVGEGIEEKLPLGGFVWEDGNILPSYKSPEEFAQTEAPAILNKGAAVLNNIDLGYQEQTGWQDVKDAFDQGGALSGSAYAEVLAYGVEQGVKSIPDMVSVVFALPTYMLARSGEIGEQRAINKGKDKADVTDILEAAPFAVASALLERIGAKGMTSKVKENLGKEILQRGVKQAAVRVAQEGGKALSKEAITEAVQEGMIEYVGEHYGTDVKMDLNEALDRAAAGAVAGGVFGGAVGTATATGVELTRPSDRFTAPPAPETPTLEPETPTAPHVNDIGNAESVTGAVDIAGKIIEDQIADHQASEDLRIANEAAQLRIQQELEGVTAEVPLSQDQIRSQELLKFEEEQQLAKPSQQDLTPIQTTEEQVQATEEIRLSKAARIKSEAEVRRREKDRPTEALVSNLTLSKDVPQIKSGADPSGVVDPLGGTYDPVGTGPIQVWVRTNGEQEVISGRHRFDLAKRSGTKTVEVQKHYEDEGFTAKDAKALDSKLNIREGQGKVKDYVDFIKSSEMDVKTAEAEGLLARNIGKQAFTIATHGSDLLIDVHSQDLISDGAATRIAAAAPGNDSLQAVGIKALEVGQPINVAENLVKAVSTIAQPEQKSGDLFGFDDAGLAAATKLAKAASAKQAEIQKTLSAIQGAAKSPKRAAAEGVNVRDPAAINKRIEQLKKEKVEWGKWHSDPDKIAQLKEQDKSASQRELALDIAKDAGTLSGLAEVAPKVAELPKEGALAKANERMAKLEKTFVKKYGDDYTVNPLGILNPKETKKFDAIQDQIDDATKQEEAAALTTPPSLKSEAGLRFNAYKTTLKPKEKPDSKGFNTFMGKMRTKFEKLTADLPKGTINNQRDFTQFVQAQTGKKTPLNEISLTRKIEGKDGKIQIAQVKADVVLRQTRKKRDVAIKLMGCIHG